MKIIITLLLFSLSFAQEKNDKDEVLNIVQSMNSAWLNKNLSECLSYFSEDTDWENSYGWSIQNRESLKKFLRDFIFKKFPKQNEKLIHTNSIIEFISPNIAFVEEAKRIDPPNEKFTARYVRTNYLLKKLNDEWLISKTRSWTPKFHNSPPAEITTANRFPSIFKLK